MKIVAILFLLVLNVSAHAFELATKVSVSNGVAELESLAGTKIKLVKESVHLKGNIVAKGSLTINGKANIIMWVKVDENYYFTKLPTLQNVKDKVDLKFNIPFNAGSETITEVLLEIELLTDGVASVSKFNVGNG